MSDTRDLFTEYVHARRPALVRTAYLLCGDNHLAEDLVQSALIKAVGRWKRIGDNPEPYLRKIMVHEFISRWRKHRGREHLTDRMPERLIEMTERDYELAKALKQLAPKQRAVIVLRYYEDLTEAETARVMGVALGTVKSQHRDALAHLRNLMPRLEVASIE